MSLKNTKVNFANQQITSGNRHDKLNHSSYLGKNVSLKDTIKKRLFLRLIVAGTIISITLSAIVFLLEFNRLGNLVNSRASEVAANFNNEVRNFLGPPISKNKKVLHNKLKMLSLIGKLDLGIGRVIYASLYDLNNNAIVIEKDIECDYLNEVENVIASLDHQLPETSQKVYNYRFIKNRPHIQLTYPLTNKDGKRAAVIEGFFSVSDKTVDEVVRRIVRSVFEAICMVLLTTIILYPIIVSLIVRLSRQADNLLDANIETLSVLGSAIAKRDSETDTHNYRVTIYSVNLAEAFGLNNNLIRALIKGAFLHDVGKIGISDQILLKPGKLTQKEFEIMKQHVDHGIDIVKRSDWLQDAKDVVAYHHEKFDGNGYPNGLKGYAIPINARIFAIADVFDALTSKRPYKEPMSFDDTMAILENGRNKHFDPSILDTFNKIAKSLHKTVVDSSDKLLREKLEHITRQYFSKDMH